MLFPLNDHILNLIFHMFYVTGCSWIISMQGWTNNFGKLGDVVFLTIFGFYISILIFYYKFN